MIISTQQAKALRETALAFARTIDKSYYEIGHLLYDLREAQVLVNNQAKYVYETWGFPTRYDWAEVELGMHVTPAKKVERIYEVFGVTLKGKWKPAQLLSKTKMYALTRILGAGTPKSKVEEWLVYAGTVSCCKLEHAIEEHIYGKTRKRKAISVLVTPKQEGIIRKAIAAVMSSTESDLATMGDALEIICSAHLRDLRDQAELREAG